MRGPGRTIQFPRPFGERARVRGPDRTIQFPLPFGERVRVRGSGRTESYIAPGGIDSLRSPYGQPVRYALSLSNWLRQLSNPQSRGLIPPAGVQHAKKKPVLAYELFFKYGGEGGIRTLDTLPYTHFPGVLLQPLGHLTILSSRCWRDGR